MSKINLTEEQKQELTEIGNLYRNAAYSEHNLPSIIDTFARALEKQEGNIAQTILSEVLLYKQLIRNRTFFDELRKWINELYHILADSLPNNVSFTIECRRKSAQSTLTKILNDYLEGNSIDLYDLIAFRIILDSLQPEESQISYCYTTSNVCMDFFRTKRCTLCAPTKKVGDSNLLKDYIKNPKSNGYQSIHLAFKTLEKDTFECQIRTLDMHEHAEIGDADHGNYKNSEYHIVTPFLSLEYDKVHIPQFRVLCNNSLYDQVGLVHALHIEKRSKTF